MYALVYNCAIQKLGTAPKLFQVPINQASFDYESGRPSARCWGGGRRGRGLLFSKKTAQVLVKWSQPLVNNTGKKPTFQKVWF
jgi:hypothetical protein